MRTKLIVALFALTCSVGVFAVESPAGSVSGRLSGATQISFGCPGPVRVGEPPCERWSSLPHARFTVSRLSLSGTPIPNSARLVTSNEHGRFTLPLPAGRYRLTLLALVHTHGGSPVTVAIRPGRTTWTLVRFLGFPRMV